MVDANDFRLLVDVYGLEVANSILTGHEFLSYREQLRQEHERAAIAASFSLRSRVSFGFSSVVVLFFFSVLLL
jgi:hypothetical protein